MSRGQRAARALSHLPPSVSQARAQAEALRISDVHFSVKPSASASSPKLHSSAAVHRLKKDIRRCHRMSRRPLPRPDPQGAAPAFARPSPLSPRRCASSIARSSRGSPSGTALS